MPKSIFNILADNEQTVTVEELDGGPSGSKPIAPLTRQPHKQYKHTIPYLYPSLNFAFL